MSINDLINNYKYSLNQAELELKDVLNKMIISSKTELDSYNSNVVLFENYHFNTIYKGIIIIQGNLKLIDHDDYLYDFTLLNHDEWEEFLELVYQKDEN